MSLCVDTPNTIIQKYSQHSTWIKLREEYQCIENVEMI